MRILHTADIHLSTKNMAVFKKAFVELLATADEMALIGEGFDLAVIAGDLFDERPVLDSPVVREAVSFVQKLSERCPVLLLQGTPSHDGNCVEVFRSVRFEEHPVMVVTKPSVVSFCGINFYCMPGMKKRNFDNWLKDGEDLSSVSLKDLVKRCLSSWKRKIAAGHRRSKSGPNVFVGHVQLEEAAAAGALQERGYEPNLSFAELFRNAGFDLGILGHVHQRGSFGRFHYCGSLIPLTAADVSHFYRISGSGVEKRIMKNRIKGFFVHDLSTDGTVQSLFVPVKSVQSVKLTVSFEGLKKLVRSTPAVLKDLKGSAADKQDQENLTETENQIVRLFVEIDFEGKSTVERDMKRASQLLDEWKAFIKSTYPDVSIDGISIANLKGLSSSSSVSKSNWERMSLADRFFVWAKRQGIDIPDSERSDYIRKIEELSSSLLPSDQSSGPTQGEVTRLS